MTTARTARKSTKPAVDDTSLASTALCLTAKTAPVPRKSKSYTDAEIAQWDPAHLHYNYLDPQDCNDPVHHQIMLLSLMGQSQTSICLRLGVSQNTVRFVLNHGPNRAYMDKKRNAVWISGACAAMGLAEGMTAAAERLRKLVGHKDPRVSLKAIEMMAKYTNFGASLILPVSSDAESGEAAGLKARMSDALPAPTAAPRLSGGDVVDGLDEGVDGKIDGAGGVDECVWGDAGDDDFDNEGDDESDDFGDDGAECAAGVPLSPAAVAGGLDSPSVAGPVVADVSEVPGVGDGAFAGPGGETVRVGGFIGDLVHGRVDERLGGGNWS
jgi:hypothetical protein